MNSIVTIHMNDIDNTIIWKYAEYLENTLHLRNDYVNSFADFVDKEIMIFSYLKVLNPLRKGTHFIYMDDKHGDLKIGRVYSYDFNKQLKNGYRQIRLPAIGKFVNKKGILYFKTRALIPFEITVNSV